MTAVIAPEQMKEVIAINGSSPAFIYLFAKSFLDYAAKVGLPETSAKELFAQSLIGSAKMITDSGYSIDELIRQVFAGRNDACRSGSAVRGQAV